MLICVSVPRTLLLASSYFIEVLLGLEPWEHCSASVCGCVHTCARKALLFSCVWSHTALLEVQMSGTQVIWKHCQKLLGSIFKKEKKGSEETESNPPSFSGNSNQQSLQASFLNWFHRNGGVEWTDSGELSVTPKWKESMRHTPRPLSTSASKHSTCTTRWAPEKGFGTADGFLGPCFANPPGYSHFRFLEIPKNVMVVLHAHNGGWNERQAGKHSSKSHAGGWRLWKTGEKIKQEKTCTSMREGRKPNEGYWENRRNYRSYHMAQEKSELWKVAGRWKSLWEVNHSSMDEQRRKSKSVINQTFKKGKWLRPLWFLF